MENKKILIGIAALACTTNLIFAGLAGAATSSYDTMTFTINPGGLVLNTAGALTLEAENGGLCNGGTISASVSDQTVCATGNTLGIIDLRPTTSDVSVTIDFGNFTGLSHSQIIPAGANGQITPDNDSNGPGFIGEIGLPDFSEVATNPFGPNGIPLTPDTPQTLYSFDKPDDSYVLFEANDEYEISLVIPGGTPADTYTNTIAFVAQ